MKTVDLTCTVAGPPEAVFDFITDQDKLGTWNTGVKSSVVEDGGPIVQGSRLLQVTDRGRSVMTVAVHDRPGHHRVETKVMGVDVAINFTFEADGEQTRLTMSPIIAGSGWRKLVEGGLFKAISGAAEDMVQRIPGAFAEHA